MSREPELPAASPCPPWPAALRAVVLITAPAWTVALLSLFGVLP